MESSAGILRRFRGNLAAWQHGPEASQLAGRMPALHPFTRPHLVEVTQHRSGKLDPARHLRRFLSRGLARFLADFFQFAGVEPATAAAGALVDFQAALHAEVAA